MTITIKTLKITKDLIFCRIWSHLVHNVLLTLTIPLEPDQRKAGERWVAVPCKFPPRHRQHRRHLRKNGASGAGLIFLQWTTACFNFHQMAVHKRTTILAHCNLKQNMWLCSKQSSFFSFYALPSGGKSIDTVIHCFWSVWANRLISNREYFYVKVYFRQMYLYVIHVHMRTRVYIWVYVYL